MVGSLGRKQLPQCACSAAHSGGRAQEPAHPRSHTRTPNPLLPSLFLCQCSARTKRIAGIKSLDIYAVALYVDLGAARSALQGRFRGASAASLSADQALFDGEPGLPDLNFWGCPAPRQLTRVLNVLPHRKLLPAAAELIPSLPFPSLPFPSLPFPSLPPFSGHSRQTEPASCLSLPDPALPRTQHVR